MVFGFTEFFISVGLVLTGLYYYLTWTYDFWTSRGIPGPRPKLFFGNGKDIIMQRCAFPTWIKGMYDEYRHEPVIGVFFPREPSLMINDLELIKTVLIRDFHNFVDRGAPRDIHEPLSQHLFLLEEAKWRPLRSKLSPVFTSGKLREMFYLIDECGDRLEKYLGKFDGECVEMRDITAKYTTDVIGRCAFGIEIDALENDESVFRQMGKRIFQLNWRRILTFRLQEFAPFLYRLIGGWLVDKTFQNFFINLTRDTIKYREENDIVRHDFIDLLRELRDDPSKIDDIELTDSLMAAQLFVFFLAGFETSSSTMSNAILELAMNHEIQGKVRDEIRAEVGKADGRITYEGIKRMKYLDKVVKETLRKYPPLALLSRQTTEAYTFPGTKISIPAKTKIMIPVYGIQHDPQYFPQPETFNPENFSEEAVKNHPQMSFLAFGDGPRNCIGARFGLVQTKIGLVKMLEKFSFDVCEKTDKKYSLNTKAFLLTPANGIIIKVNKCTK